MQQLDYPTTVNKEVLEVIVGEQVSVLIKPASTLNTAVSMVIS